ncbi:hypothetical protein [Pyxidicoccus fallax]|uniref:hypothetical protein n=1 Tax=Pyxidicoccus fallax TaxID=394095 RepID=UPI001FE5C735|nr:hypothetical protein [Pyxidicoccus fallax]
MKLLGRDIPARELIARIEERLRLRGLPTSEPVEVPAEGVEPRVEPLTFNLHALEENADATRALPLHTHRGGAGQLVLVAKWAFRKSCQVFINEALGRQRVFNGHVRDSYAQLSAEVIRLRREVEQLRARAGGKPVPAAADGELKRVDEAAARQGGTEQRVSSPDVPAKAAGSTKPDAAAEVRPAESAPRAKQATSRVPSTKEQARRPRESAPAAKPPPTSEVAPRTSTAQGPERSGGRASKKPSSPGKTARRAKQGAAGQNASEAKSTTSSEPVLPRPRHARGGAGEPTHSQAKTPRVRPETEGAASRTTGNTGPRSRKPDSRPRGRRK